MSTHCSDPNRPTDPCAHTGEYAERIDNADELLESFLDGYSDENSQAMPSHDVLWRATNNMSTLPKSSSGVVPIILFRRTNNSIQGYLQLLESSLPDGCSGETCTQDCMRMLRAGAALSTYGVSYRKYHQYNAVRCGAVLTVRCGLSGSRRAH